MLNTEKVLDALRGESLTVAEIQVLTEINKITVRNAINSLMKTGRVQRGEDREGKATYRVSPETVIQCSRIIRPKAPKIVEWTGSLEQLGEAMVARVKFLENRITELEQELVKERRLYQDKIQDLQEREISRKNMKVRLSDE